MLNAPCRADLPVNWVGFYYTDRTNPERPLILGPFQGKDVVGVFDLDSPVVNGFDEVDKQGIENIVQLLLDNTSSWTL
ncbi:hypothetical protein AX774_g935 [Zancudomyces culisetae]|uniref:Uncharacterized protein n=1 Tax=Zancudomyces culisetae TaxID=1213189 RepID=A0A1R1PX59_ZANCU|nr:hypothetical protein AX774_g935 [Zancudomyces culisetae]|eukprot:OMH85503.1 hypothetical protein AX774_g935 [Zancudomyces culisetae]